jgi:DNA recombination protein RmuC
MLIVAIVLLVIAVALLLMLLKKTPHADDSALFSRLDAFDKQLERAERSIREEGARSRDELGKSAKEQRQELTEAVKALGDSVVRRMMDVSSLQKVQLDTFSDHLASFAKASGERLDGVRLESATGARQLREEVVTTLKSISETMVTTMKDMGAAEKAQLEAMSSVMGKLSDSNEKKLETIRVTLEGKLQSMQADNAKQLEQMRQTVDEKLQGTLDKRLGESFKQVSDRLEQVHKGLGEMQTLATGVGDLKKVLSNVKTRGTWGEVQLGALLEQALNPDQFATNVATKDGGERVEYAVRFLGQGTNRDETVWLPIDAKFPIEDYQRLIEAQELADVAAVEIAGKQLENRVKACAKDISEKYLNPPTTTDFAILFLPIEGLFAEVIRRIGLTEIVQRERRVVIAGPTTLWALLNSLQMGFRTLAIQKRSSEVWNLLAAVKTEWTKYGEVLDTVQKKMQSASKTIEELKVRSRSVGKRLKDVQELPIAEVAASLPENLLDDNDEEAIDSERLEND